MLRAALSQSLLSLWCYLNTFTLVKCVRQKPDLTFAQMPQLQPQTSGVNVKLLSKCKLSCEVISTHCTSIKQFKP